MCCTLVQIPHAQLCMNRLEHNEQLGDIVAQFREQSIHDSQRLRMVCHKLFVRILCIYHMVPWVLGLQLDVQRVQHGRNLRLLFAFLVRHIRHHQMHILVHR